MQRPPSSVLERRVLWVIGLICAALGVLNVTSQWMLYRHNSQTELKALFTSVAHSHVPSITESSWNFDRHQVELQMNGLVKLTYVAHVKIIFGEDNHFEVGQPIEAGLVQEFPLIKRLGNRDIMVGTLWVTADTQAVCYRILMRLLLMSVLQLGQVLLLVGTLWWLMRRMVLQPIQLIANFARQMPQDQVPPLVVKSQGRDEISTLVDDLNHTYLVLVASREHERRYRHRLEQAVEQRTQELAWSTERLELCLEAGRLATWDWDIETSQNSVDERWTAMLGYEPWQYEGNFDQFFQWVHPQDRAGLSEAIAAHLQRSTPFFEYDIRMQHRLGHYLWIHSSGRVVNRREDGQPLRMVGIHQYITHRKDSESALQRIERQSRTFAAIVDSHVLFRRFNLEGELTEVSEAFCRRSGYSRLALIGQTWRAILTDDIGEAPWTQLTTQAFWEGDLRYRHREGEVFWLHVTITTVREENKITGYTEIGHDITDRLALKKLSITDDLTGLFNRRHFNYCYKLWCDGPNGLLLLLADIDFFKQYNDHYGHHAGDQALQQVARMFQQLVENYQTSEAVGAAFRIGGEEFAVLLCTDHPEVGEQLAERLRQQLTERPIVHNHSRHQVLTLSMGLHWQFGHERVSLEVAYQLADDALYRAKNAGRNNFIWANRKSDEVTKLLTVEMPPITLIPPTAMQ